MDEIVFPVINGVSSADKLLDMDENIEMFKIWVQRMKLPSKKKAFLRRPKDMITINRKLKAIQFLMIILT